MTSSKTAEALARGRSAGRVAAGRACFRLAPGRGVDPAVAELVELLRPYAGHIAALSRAAGIHRQSVRKWSSGQRTPNVANLRAALNAIGYDLAVVIKEG